MHSAFQDHFPEHTTFPTPMQRLMDANLIESVLWHELRTLTRKAIVTDGMREVLDSNVRRRTPAEQRDLEQGMLKLAGTRQGAQRAIPKPRPKRVLMPKPRAPRAFLVQSTSHCVHSTDCVNSKCNASKMHQKIAIPSSLVA